MRRWLKRSIDIVVASSALLLLSPVLVIVALGVWRYLGRPIIFHQVRPGLHGRPFRMYKFRTMLDLRYANGELLPDSDRQTPFGRFLRSTSLDELPELLNVLVGDMSVVGPRPLLMEYLDRYTMEQARRHEVLPGVTGWAQVNGRNSLSWEEKFRLDVWYVDNWSLMLDLRILYLTVLKVIYREGVSAEGYATAPLFMGTDKSNSVK